MAVPLYRDVAGERERRAHIVEALITDTNGEEDFDDAMPTVAAALRDGHPAEYRCDRGRRYNLHVAGARCSPIHWSMEWPLIREGAAERERCARFAEAMALACEALKCAAKILASSDLDGNDWQRQAPHHLQLAIASLQLALSIRSSDAQVSQHAAGMAVRHLGRAATAIAAENRLVLGIGTSSDAD